MNKSELIAKIAETSKLDKKEVVKMLDGFTQAVTEELASGGEVALVGFGTFKANLRKSRTGRNPQTGESLKIPAKKAPVFRAGKALKDAVNGV